MLFYVLFDPRLWVFITIVMLGDAGRTGGGGGGGGGGYGYSHGHGGEMGYGADRGPALVNLFLPC